MKTANKSTLACIYTRARALARTPLRTLACAWMVLIALFLGGAGNVAWGQSDQTTTVNIQRSTSDKNVTLPLGTYKVTVECWGAGGAGGTSTDAHGAAGGGGGGGYAATEYSIT